MPLTWNLSSCQPENLWAKFWNLYTPHYSFLALSQEICSLLFYNKENTEKFWVGKLTFAYFGLVFVAKAEMYKLGEAQGQRRS